MGGYSWDERGRRVNFRWKNFEKIEPLDTLYMEEFIRDNT